MPELLNHYRSVILQSTNLSPTDERLLISRNGSLSSYYAPFEHINPQARVVLLGITPGAQQASNALNALRTALKNGAKDEAALAIAKETASFSGPMRANLVAMLDHIGVNEILGIRTCIDLFSSRTDLVHFTSALRNPVFIDGENYSGNPSILKTSYLKSMITEWLELEIKLLNNAIWIPLGKEPIAVMNAAVRRGLIANHNVLADMPHPSGANAERIAYFLGNKSRETLSAKTNPELIDSKKANLLRAVASVRAKVA